MRVSHPHYRYSCQHKLLQDLQRSLRYAFSGNCNVLLPYQVTGDRIQKTGASYQVTERIFLYCNLYPVTCNLMPVPWHLISVASVLCLAPLHFRRRSIRPVSYYAFFKGLLLLSQPPGCIHSSTSFPTEHRFWDLS